MMNATGFEYGFGKRTLGRLTGLGLATLLVGTLAVGAASAEEWTKTYTVSGRARVRVDTNDSAVRVTSGDTKQVEFRVTYEGYKIDKDLTITTPGGFAWITQDNLQNTYDACKDNACNFQP